MCLVKVLLLVRFSVCTFSASRVTRQIKMRRVVEYPFRRRTIVRQRRISAREKVNIIKIVSGVYNIGNAHEAFEALTHNDGTLAKLVIQFGD